MHCSCHNKNQRNCCHGFRFRTEHVQPNWKEPTIRHNDQSWSLSMLPSYSKRLNRRYPWSNDRTRSHASAWVLSVTPASVQIKCLGSRSKIATCRVEMNSFQIWKRSNKISIAFHIHVFDRNSRLVRRHLKLVIKSIQLIKRSHHTGSMLANSVWIAHDLAHEGVL